MSTGQISKFQKGKGYESIPRELLQDTNLSLEAIGLLSYMQSLPENWKLYKTELYTRFPKNKRRSIDNIWKELVENNYLLNFRKRDGRKYVYSYVFTVTPFTKEETEELIKAYVTNDGWDVIFEQSTVNSSKRTDSKLNNKKVLHKNDEIDTFIDTEQEQAPKLDLDKLSNEIESELKDNSKEGIPNAAKETFKAFSLCFTSTTYELIGIALRAKKASSDKANRFLQFEQFEEEFVTATRQICNYIYKSKKGETKRVVDNPESFLYQSYINYFDNQAYKLEQIEEGNTNIQVPMFNWLEG